MSPSLDILRKIVIFKVGLTVVQVICKSSFVKTSTGLYRSCAALASFSGTFDLILFQAVNFELIVEKVWFGLVWIDGLNKQKITGFWFALIEFGLVWFAYSTDTQTNK